MPEHEIGTKTSLVGARLPSIFRLDSVGSDAELAGDGTHVQVAVVARVALAANLGVEHGAAAVGIDAEANPEVTRVELAKEMRYEGVRCTHTPRSPVIGRSTWGTQIGQRGEVGWGE